MRWRRGYQDWEVADRLGLRKGGESDMPSTRIDSDIEILDGKYDRRGRFSMTLRDEDGPLLDRQHQYVLQEEPTQR